MVGLRDGRIKCGQHLAAVDDLADLHLDLADDRGLERLNNQLRRGRYQFPLRRDDGFHA